MKRKFSNYGKAILCAVILLMSLMLTSCLRILTYYEYEFLHPVDSYDGMTVQIVELTDGIDHNTDSKAAIFDNMTVLGTVSDVDAFMKDFDKQKHNMPLGDPDLGIKKGKAILITYADGVQELIAKQGCALIEGDSVDVRYHGWFPDFEAFEAFLEGYLSE